MDKFMEILERFYCLIYTFAWLGLLDWLESSGAFERVFKRPMAYWHGVVLLLIFVALAVVLPVAFYFASSFVYQILPWQFKYDTVKVSSLRFCCDHAAANGFPVTYKELEELEFAPYFSSEPFDPFVYHVLKQRTLFMNSVLDSLLFRRKLLKIVEWIFVIIYLFLPRN